MLQIFGKVMKQVSTSGKILAQAVRGLETNCREAQQEFLRHGRLMYGVRRLSVKSTHYRPFGLVERSHQCGSHGMVGNSFAVFREHCTRCLNAPARRRKARVEAKHLTEPHNMFSFIKPL